MRLSDIVSDGGDSHAGRALAGACVLEHASGMRRPFLLVQWGATVQLSAMDMGAQREQSMFGFQLPDEYCSPLPRHSCMLGAGPSLCIHLSGSSVLVVFPSEASTADDGRPGGWQVFLLKLSGSSVMQPLLCSAAARGHMGLPGPVTVALTCERQEGAGMVAHSAVVLRCCGDQHGQWSWAAEQVEQRHAVAAMCLVPALPRAASAALAAGCRAPGGCVAIATRDGALCLFRRTSGVDLGSFLVSCLRQLSMQPATDACAPMPAASALDGGAEGQERLADALLASSAASWQRKRMAQEALAQKQRGGGLIAPSGDGQEREAAAAAGAEGRVQLPRPPVQLAFAPRDAAEGLLLALSREGEGELCCLTWPGLRQMEPLLEGVAGVVVLDSCGLSDAHAGLCCTHTAMQKTAALCTCRCSPAHTHCCIRVMLALTIAVTHDCTGEQVFRPALNGLGSCSAVAVLHASAAKGRSTGAIAGLASPVLLLPAYASGMLLFNFGSVSEWQCLS